MASSAESQMNLAALQQRDPYITNIIDTASQVALYSFSAKKNEWEKTDIEGALFVYTRSAAPHNGFTIVNRLSMNNLTEPITKDLEFQLQDPFLLYRNAQHQIYGIWFYDKDECARVGQHMNSLTQWAASSASSEHSPRRQRRASVDGATPVEGSATGGAGKREVDILQMLSKAQDEYDKQPDSDAAASEKRVDILQLLSKAQGDYNKQSKQPSGAEPKPMIDNLTSRAEGGTGGLVRPVALKPEPAASQAQAPPSHPRPVNLATLFNQPVDQRPVQVSEQPSSHHPAAMAGKQPQSDAGKMPVLLQRLMSNPGIGERVTTLESLEADQLGVRGAEAAGGSGEPQFQPDQLVEQLNLLKLQQQDPGVEEAGDVPTSPGTNLLKMLQSSPAAYAASTTTDSGNLLLKSLQAMAPQPGSLLTPQAFEAAAVSSPLPQSGHQRTRMSSTSSGSSVLPGSSSLETAASHFRVHPLSKEQLKQGLLYLLQNDEDFVDKIHEGYLQSLKPRRDSNL